MDKYGLDISAPKEDETFNLDIHIEEGDFKDFVVRLYDINFEKLPEVEYSYQILHVPKDKIDKEFSQEFEDLVGKIFVDVLKNSIETAKDQNENRRNHTITTDTQ